jgi:hypothetical protein
MRLLFSLAACLSLILAVAANALPAQDLEVVAELPVGPGNITVTPRQPGHNESASFLHAG